MQLLYKRLYNNIFLYLIGDSPALLDKFMKRSRSEILEILSLHKPDLMRKYHLGKLGLFGSYARNEALEDSDIDILVDFTQPVGMEIVDLTLELENILNHHVDIVTLNAVKHRLYNYIKQDLIYV